MANIVGKYGVDVLLPYLKTIIACYLTCALFTIFVQGGLLAGIDRILNMARVIPNIVGDAAAAVVVAKSEGELHPELVEETAND